MTVVYPTNTALGRFGIANLIDSPDPFVSSMPLAGLVNPATGAVAVGPLAVLVDHAAGLVNHYRRADDEWTVSSELSLELTPTALTVIADSPDVAVVATGRPVGTRGSSRIRLVRVDRWRRRHRDRNRAVRVRQTPWRVPAGVARACRRSAAD